MPNTLRSNKPKCQNWSREEYIAGPCKGSSCSKNPKLQEEFRQIIFKSQMREGRSQGMWSVYAQSSDWLMVR